MSVKEDTAFLVAAGAEEQTVIGNAAGKPVAVPQVLVCGAIDFVGGSAEFAGKFGAFSPRADIGPKAEGIRGGHGQPTGDAFAAVADHVHGIAPIALGNVA